MVMEEVSNCTKKQGKGNVGFVQLLFVVCVVLCALFLYTPRVIPYNYRSMILSGVSISSAAAGDDGEEHQQQARQEEVVLHLDNQVRSPCSAMRDDSICCDRSDFNTDVCFMAGDVRTDAKSLSLLLFPPNPKNKTQKKKVQDERIRPYTRKWESLIMSKVQEVRLRRPDDQEAEEGGGHARCDVRHDAPLLVMTAGGYTGNLFHAFSDGFLPAWVTTQHLRRRVVLGVLSYNPWWAGTFSHLIKALSRYDVVDLVNDRRTHCFPGAIVGTRFHGILNVDPSRLRDNRTLVDFHDFLAAAYDGYDDGGDDDRRIPHQSNNSNTPRLGIVSRKGTRVIENQADVVNLARSVGFDVRILDTANRMPLSAVYAAVRACDALVGVHGADLTKFLFLRPGHASLTQIVPLGVSSIARDCFGKPSARMGLRYEQYEVLPHESSLSRSYAADDDVVADPEKAKRNRGWAFVSQVYLKGQNVTLDLARFRQTLARMHAHATTLAPSRHQP